MTVNEILIATRKVLEDPKRWTQGIFARDAKGLMENPKSPYAVCFCLLGALENVCPLVSPGDYLDYYAARAHLGDVLARTTPPGLRMYTPAAFNDEPGRTHAEILELLDKAIAEAPCSG